MIFKFKTLLFLMVDAQLPSNFQFEMRFRFWSPMKFHSLCGKLIIFLQRIKEQHADKRSVKNMRSVEISYFHNWAQWYNMIKISAKATIIKCRKIVIFSDWNQSTLIKIRSHAIIYDVEYGVLKRDFHISYQIDGARWYYSCRCCWLGSVSQPNRNA